MKLREGLFCLIPTKLTKLHHLQDFCANFSHVVCCISGGFIDSSGSLLHLSACLPLLSLLWAPAIRTVVFPSVRPVVENPSAKDAEDKSASPCRSLVLFPIDHQANSEWPASCSEGIVKHIQKRFKFFRKYLKTHCWAQAAQWGSPLSMLSNPSK